MLCQFIYRRIILFLQFELSVTSKFDASDKATLQLLRGASRSEEFVSNRLIAAGECTRRGLDVGQESGHPRRARLFLK